MNTKKQTGVMQMIEFQFYHDDETSTMSVETTQHNKIEITFRNSTGEFVYMSIDGMIEIEPQHEVQNGLFVSIKGEFICLQDLIHRASDQFDGCLKEAEQDAEDYVRHVRSFSQPR